MLLIEIFAILNIENNVKVTFLNGRAPNNTYKKLNTNDLNENEESISCHNLSELDNEEKSEKISSTVSDT